MMLRIVAPEKSNLFAKRFKGYSLCRNAPDCGYLRPLTSVICKLFEWILEKCLLSFLSETLASSSHQHSFLPRCSCLSNLLVFTCMTDEGHTVDDIYLDFTKAFDSVNYRFLLAKKKSFGLGDVVVRWIEAYLSGRVSRVHVGGEHSGAIPMHSGVPQGSVVGPLLFLLFVIDLPNVHEALTLLFANYVKMATPRTQYMSLRSSRIATWGWPKK